MYFMYKTPGIPALYRFTFDRDIFRSDPFISMVGLPLYAVAQQPRFLFSLKYCFLHTRNCVQ